MFNNVDSGFVNKTPLKIHNYVPPAFISRLKSHYNVDSTESLVVAQYKHIEKLQAMVDKYKGQSDTFRRQTDMYVPPNDNV